MLIFSHGCVGLAERNTVQMEELASHGYIIRSISHTYYALATVFADEQVVAADSAVLNELV